MVKGKKALRDRVAVRSSQGWRSRPPMFPLLSRARGAEARVPAKGGNTALVHLLS